MDDIPRNYKEKIYNGLIELEQNFTFTHHPNMMIVHPDAWIFPASLNPALVTPGIRFIITEVKLMEIPFEWLNLRSWPKIKRHGFKIRLERPKNFYSKVRILHESSGHCN